MWAGAAWNQWALQPATYQNVPHEQIDWAALAKQWIQMQQRNQQTDPHVAPPPPPPPPLPPPLLETPQNGNPESQSCELPLVHLPPPGHAPISVVEGNEDSGPVVPPGANTNFVQGDMMGGYWEGSWGMGGWVPPPGTVQNATPGKETFEYGHITSNPTIAPQTYDYNHSSDQYNYNQMFTNDNQYDQFWPQVGPNANIVSAPFLKRNKIAPPGEHSPRSEEEMPPLDINNLDAVKRKQLPAWIREGLEKMERERQRKLEKEKADKEQIEKFNTVDASQEKTSGDEKSLSSVDEIPIKSKFESESEDEIESIKEEKESSPQVIVVPSPEIVNKTEEEKQQELMLRVRRMLTEILLDVTTDQMLNVAKEVHQKALSKAPARQLATSSALASIASGLGGLAGYGTDTDSAADEEGSDSDEELHHIIYEKRRSFAEKEKWIVATLEKEEAAEREKQKLHEETKISEKARKEKKEEEKPTFICPSPDAEKSDTNGKLLTKESKSEIVIQEKKQIETNSNLASDKSDISKGSKLQIKSKSSESSSDSEEDSSSSSSLDSSDTRKNVKKRDKKGGRQRRDCKEEYKTKKRDISRDRRRRSSRSRSRERDRKQDSDRHRKDRNDRRRRSRSRKRSRHSGSGDRKGRSSSRDRRDRSSSRDRKGRFHSRSRGRYNRSRSRSTSRGRSRHRVSILKKSRVDRSSSRSSSSSRSRVSKKSKKSSKYSYRHSCSRSRSRTPKRRRTSRSLSSESEESGKKSREKQRNR